MARSRLIWVSLLLALTSEALGSVVINEIHYHPRLEPSKPDVFAETADQEREHAKRFFKFLEGGEVDGHLRRIAPGGHDAGRRFLGREPALDVGQAAPEQDEQGAGQGQPEQAGEEAVLHDGSLNAVWRVCRE